MSDKNKPPADDDFERDLAALSRAYGSTKRAEPSPAIDDAIRAAARRAVHAGPGVGRRSWFSQYATPVATAAVLVLTVSVGLLSLEQRPDLATSDVRQDAPVKPKAVAPAAIPEPTQVPAAASVPATPAPQAPPTSMPFADAAPPTAKLRAQEAAPMREEKRREPDANVQESFTPAPALAPPAKAAMPAPSAAPLAKDSVEIGQRTLAAPAAQAPAAAGAAASGMLLQRAKKESMDSIARAPEAWLKDIADLNRDGKKKEALEELEKFRKRFPDYVLPPELRDLR